MEGLDDTSPPAFFFEKKLREGALYGGKCDNEEGLHKDVEIIMTCFCMKETL
jgi:hypothetical protein